MEKEEQQGVPIEVYSERKMIHALVEDIFMKLRAYDFDTLSFNPAILDKNTLYKFISENRGSLVEFIAVVRK